MGCGLFSEFSRQITDAYLPVNGRLCTKWHNIACGIFLPIIKLGAELQDSRRFADCLQGEWLRRQLPRGDFIFNLLHQSIDAGPITNQGLLMNKKSFRQWMLGFES